MTSNFVAMTRYLRVALMTSLAPLMIVNAAGASGVPYVPSANVSPVPNFLGEVQCTGVGSGSYRCPNPCYNAAATWPINYNHLACSLYLAQAITHARSLEGVGPLVLPSNWTSLSVPEQLFVVLDLERVARGYPPYLGLNTSLSAEAQTAAATPSDPMPDTSATWVPSSFGGAWGDGNDPLEADYEWMYYDGWGGSASATTNGACTSAGSPGCWAHREELLGSAPGFNTGVGLDCATCEVGAGSFVLSVGTGVGSYVLLVQRPAGTPPATYFSWAQEEPYFSEVSATTTTTTSLPRASIPRRIVLGAHHLSATRASVVWGFRSTTPGSITLKVYRGAGCTQRVAYGASSFNSRDWGVLQADGRFTRGNYSARVSSEKAVSACISLGSLTRAAWRARRPRGY